MVCAIIEQESAWDTWAIRYEMSFLKKYVWPLYEQGGMNQTEAYARSISWGLLQIMGQVARERGFTGRFLSELCNPEIGIEYGCKQLKWLIDKNTGHDVHAILLRWNGGGSPHYPDEVLARMINYA